MLIEREGNLGRSWPNGFSHLTAAAGAASCFERQVMLDAQPRPIVPCCDSRIVAAKLGGGSAVAAVGPGARSVFSVSAFQCRRGQRNSNNRQRREPVADFVLFRISGCEPIFRPRLRE